MLYFFYLFRGMVIEGVTIKNVTLSENLEDLLEIEGKAVRLTNARLIHAQEEKKVSMNLVKAAEIMSDCPIALQLRYLETLASISAENNSTIVLPMSFEDSNVHMFNL
jgi:erythrocyte band 7 integral membrane protein